MSQLTALCPYCQHEVERLTSDAVKAASEAKAKEVGARLSDKIPVVALCPNCTEPLVYDGESALRKPTDEEFEFLVNNRAYQQQRDAFVAMKEQKRVLSVREFFAAWEDSQKLKEAPEGIQAFAQRAFYAGADVMLQFIIRGAVHQQLDYQDFCLQASAMDLEMDAFKQWLAGQVQPGQRQREEADNGNGRVPESDGSSNGTGQFAQGATLDPHGYSQPTFDAGGHDADACAAVEETSAADCGGGE